MTYASRQTTHLLIAGLLASSVVAAGPRVVQAAPLDAPAKVHTANPAATEFSSQRRHRRGPSPAGMAVMGAAVGIIGTAIAAAERDRYYDSYGYYGAPPAYGPGYGYYGPRYRAAPGYYDGGIAPYGSPAW